ncbi:hypothetical protein ALP8811_01542 [Aliiroseovarius pelagivivens]|uniref:Uncharacterized protein n=1 Tax=Aliiroseovarius pelagivivens TaxID=1639690 RepID=A0A2R8AKX2_9RHOB|nr:hypothetical protein ALP8811_01542 [Aliiroseovarius pelagivivens]
MPSKCYNATKHHVQNNYGAVIHITQTFVLFAEAGDKASTAVTQTDRNGVIH